MYACIAVAVLARGVSRIYCLAVILVLHGEGVGLQVQKYKLFFILFFFRLFFSSTRICLTETSTS